MADRRRDVHDRTMPRHGDKVQAKTDNGIADLRQFTLNRKVGSPHTTAETSLSLTMTSSKFGDEFIEADPAMPQPLSTVVLALMQWTLRTSLRWSPE